MKTEEVIGKFSPASLLVVSAVFVVRTVTLLKGEEEEIYAIC